MAKQRTRCSYCGRYSAGLVCSSRTLIMVPTESWAQDAPRELSAAEKSTGMRPADSLLMQAVRSGSKPALEEFARRTRCIPRMVASLNRRIGRALDDHELADVSQEVLLTAWQKSAAFDGLTSLESWIYRIAFLKVMNRGRKTRRRSVVVLGLEANEMGKEAEQNPLEYEDLHRCLDALPGPEEQVIRLKHFEDLTFEEIAAYTKTSANTLKTRYYRARLQLESCLRRSGHTEMDLK